jgi:glucose-6-phosphate dehydrogenase assembly protein OpcA
MATAYKVLGQVTPTASTLTALYTVPASKSAVISTITVANLTGTANTFRIAIRPAGESIANKHYVAYDVAVAAADTTTLTLGITLATTDVISVFGGAASVLSFGAFGSELDA